MADSFQKFLKNSFTFRPSVKRVTKITIKKLLGQLFGLPLKELLQYNQKTHPSMLNSFQKILRNSSLFGLPWKHLQQLDNYNDGLQIKTLLSETIINSQACSLKTHK